MSDLVGAIGRAAARHPETGYLGDMFHSPTSDDDGTLQDLRGRVEHWLLRAITHGREVGVIRDDLPDEVLIEHR